jgi:hypothetical protein
LKIYQIVYRNNGLDHGLGKFPKSNVFGRRDPMKPASVTNVKVEQRFENGRFVRIELNLDSHCVETEIRRIYNLKVRSCLKNRRVTTQDADVVELLKKLIETVDFSRLRSSVHGVLQEKILPTALVADGDKSPWIEIGNKRIGMDGSGLE